MTQYKLTNLVNDESTEIRYVYHLSDIHIRNIERWEEYAQVFDRTYEKIKSECKNKEKQSLIILTGDIMHNKTEISPNAYKIAYQLFNSLSNILPVILIAGNHDCIVSNQDRLDALTPIMDSGIGLEDIYYLKKTGFYQYHNIIFGLTDMFTDSPLLSENIKSSMYKKIKQKNKYKIALYHGPIRGSKTDAGYKMKSERFRSKDFRGYDYGFFGDIHKFQYMNDQKTMAYAGSLIQQSHGETLNNHGILKWDLLTGKSNLFEIPNDYGYCTINVLNGKIIDKIIPKNPRIRLILDNTTQIQFQQIKDEIEEKYGVCTIVKEDKSTMTNSRFTNSNPVLVGPNHNKFIKSYLDKQIPDDITRKKIYKLHKQIYDKIINNTNIDYNVGGQHWKFIELKFSNMFSYKGDNVVNLAQYNYNQIIGIVAPNHYGKSSILDIILYCLFEKSSRGIARSIMNQNERTMSCSLLFSIGENKYLIERKAIRGKNDIRMDLAVKFTKINKNGKQKNLNGISKPKTNKNIIELIGTCEDYLTSYICTQDQENHGNFMKKTNQKKKEYLYEILKLNIFDECYKYANDKLKTLNVNIKSQHREIDRLQIKYTKRHIKELNNEYIALVKEKQHTNSFMELIETSLVIIKKPDLVKYHDLSIYDLESEEDIINTINDLKTKIKNTDSEKILKQISTYKKSISDLKKEQPCDELVSKYNEEIQELYDKIINIPINKKDMNSDTLIKNKNDLKSKIINIDESITQLTDKKESINCIANKKISQKQRDILTEQLKMKNEFAKHINKTIKYIDLCNDKNVDSVLNLQNRWLNKFNDWKTETKSLLMNETYNLAEMNNQINLLNTQKETLSEKLSVICDKIENLDLYQKHINTNEKIQTEIQKIKTNIKKLEHTKLENKTKIKNLKESIKEYNDLLNDSKNYKTHIDLLENFKMTYMDYLMKKDKYDKTVDQKNELTINLNNIEYRINNNKLKLSYQTNTLTEYERLNAELNDMENNKDIYNMYCQMINNNGVPYEILKTILPQLEAKVNQTLHNMVNFDIEFIFYNERKTTKVTKSAIYAIDIHIHYHNKKSYDANLTSGFEKFIIGLAIRMVLCNISKCAKPNFFIIDEGWSCLDTENLSNIDNIMTYIKNQFEHVIIISHLGELKNQSDYIININKRNIGRKDEHSFVNNLKKASY
jgi:DNA repair exonuclease SbcCD ATPase subunit